MSSIDTADAKYFTTEELTQYNGKDENTPIYISIKVCNSLLKFLYKF